MAVSLTTVRRAAVLLAVVVLLNASLTFANLWPTPMIAWRADLSAELALFLLALAIARWRGWVPSPRALRVITIGWVLLVIARYADVTVQGLFGREINLYWEARTFGSVSAMLTTVTNPALVAAVAAAVVLAPILLYLPLRWALRHVSASMGDPSTRRVLASVAAITLVLAVIQHREEQYTEIPQFASMVTPIYARQLRLMASEMSGTGRPELPAPPDIESNFARVAGADVFIIFLESYGAASWERPEFARGLTPARERFVEAIEASDRDVVSAYAESPTFGGSSWLAHLSLLSGTEVRDGATNMRLMAQRGRPTLVTAFARHGYRTVAVMPGLRRPWQEGEFYGFDEIYGEQALDYQGPSFGWWDVTDQYALAKVDALAVSVRPRPPIFVVLPTISTHVPFLPVPPYQPDWSRMLSSTPYEPATEQAAWQQTPDWEDLGPGYVKALAYAYDAIGGYLRWRADREFVVVLLGDHQPPALVSGTKASWDVPVHIIASRPELLRAFAQRGFIPGLAPRRPALTKISGLMGILLDAFDGEGKD